MLQPGQEGCQDEKGQLKAPGSEDEQSAEHDENETQNDDGCLTQFHRPSLLIPERDAKKWIPVFRKNPALKILRINHDDFG